MHTNFNCKAVVVTVIEKVNGRKNNRWRRRIKKNIGQVLKQLEEFLLTKRKPDLNWTVNGLGTPFRKKCNAKKDKKWKPNCRMWTKMTIEKANSCSNTIFSLYFKIPSEKMTPQNQSLFCSTYYFGVTKITTPVWPQKSWKCQVFKKQRPSTIPILRIVKNHDVQNNIRYRFAAINHTEFSLETKRLVILILIPINSETQLKIDYSFLH